MNIETLNKEMISALKNKDKQRKETISSIIGSVKNAAIAEKCRDNITEELVNKVLLKELKTVNEMIETCPDERIELKDQYIRRLHVIEEFAPKVITDENEIINIINNLNIKLTKENRGEIMKSIKTKNIDMKTANMILGKILK